MSEHQVKGNIRSTSSGRASALALAVAGLLGCGAASATTLSLYDFALYGGGGATINSNTNYETRAGSDVTINGAIGSNEDVEIYGGATVTGDVMAGRNFRLGSGAVVGANGSPVKVIANGVADIDNGKVWGDVHGSGLYGSTGTNTYSVIVRPANPVGLGDEITGNVYTKYDLRFSQTSGIAIGGNATVGGAVTNQGSNTIAGTTTTGSTSGLLTWGGLTMPAPSFTSGDASTNPTDDRTCKSGCSTLTLMPGVYSDLDIGTDKSLYLSSGSYYFQTINILSGLDLFFDLSSGNPLNMFVVGDANFGSDQIVWLKGPGDSGYSQLTASGTNTSLASLIYLETLGAFNINSKSEWAGTVYASKKEADGSAEVFVGSEVKAWGAFYAYDSVNVTDKSVVNYVRSYLGNPPQPPSVPEPGSLALLGLGLAGLGLSRRRKTN